MTSEEAHNPASGAIHEVATTIDSVIASRIEKIEKTQKRRGREHLVYMIGGFIIILGMLFLTSTAFQNSADNKADAEKDQILNSAVADLQEQNDASAKQINDIIESSKNTTQPGVSKDQLQSAIDALPESASLIKEVAQSLLDYIPDPVPGPQGEPGESGAPYTGPPPADGSDGAEGSPGPEGEEGNDGTDGANGISVIGITQPDQCSVTFSLSDGSSFTASNLCGAQGPTGATGTVQPGTYTCETGAFMNSLTVSETGAISIFCAVPDSGQGEPAPTEDPTTTEAPTEEPPAEPT